MLEGNKRNIIGAQVRHFRKDAGLSQDELAARCSVQGFEIGRATVSHIETGIRGVSDLEMVIVARALRIDMRDLVPKKLPKWKKDVRPPSASEDDLR